jgi:DNA-binding response OmpR family regulator
MNDPAIPAQGAPGTSAARIEILVVDDSQELADAMALMLNDAGYATRVAYNGRAALAAVNERRPALILTDALMPEMTGLELLTALRSDLAPPVPPVVVVSGFPAIEREALRRGAADFLHKPVSAGELVAAARRVLTRSERPPDVAERTKQRALEARREVSRAAAAVFAQLDRADGLLRATAVRLARWLVAYHGFGTAIVVAIHPSAIEPLAEERWPDAGVVALKAAESFLRDIAETRSSLLVRDTERYAPAFASMTSAGAIRFFAGVPFVAPDAVPVGAIVLMDAAPRAFATSDLRMLEYLGRAGSERLEDVVEGHPHLIDPLVDDDGVLEARTFRELLAIELDRAVEGGEGLAVGIAATATTPHARRAPRAPSVEGVRLGAGRLAVDSVSCFKRDSSVERAAEVLEAALAERALGSDPLLAGIIRIAAAALPMVDAHTALDLAERALLEARRRCCTLRFSLAMDEPSADGHAAAR